VGQKVNPIGFRLPVTKSWLSRWYADKKHFGDVLHEDLQIRSFVKKQLQDASVSKIEIERFANRVRLTVHSARPGLVIGRKGAQIERLKKDIGKFCAQKEILIDIKEIKAPELDAQLVAEGIATQLERRVSFRRAMKRSVQSALEMKAQGIKIRCAGRLGGAELARTEQYKEGKIPLHTLRENIDYGVAEASTTAGKIGVKVWICKPVETEEQNNAVDAKTGEVPQGTKKKKFQKRNR
jgi:small subunit ribosomal protein S3